MGGLRWALGPGLMVLLVGFHALLLWQRLTSLTLLQPLVAARYLAGALLLYGFYRLRRAEVPLWRGRKALVIWALVVLLHASAAVPASEGKVEVAAEPGVVLLTTLVVVAASAVLRRLLRPLPEPHEAPRPPYLSRFDIPAQLAFKAGWSPAFSPRPPPAAAAA